MAIPSTNGSRMGLSSHSRPIKIASAAIQNTMLRSNRIVRPQTALPQNLVAGAERIHVADPFGEIEGDRKQRQERDRSHGQSRQQSKIKAERPLREDQNRQ